MSACGAARSKPPPRPPRSSAATGRPPSAADRLWRPIPGAISRRATLACTPQRRRCVARCRYGALTGLSKKKTRLQYGDEQFKKWRRSYDTKPPAVSSFSQHYPGNDQRYVENIRDVRVSSKETLIRSLEAGKLVVGRRPTRPRRRHRVMGGWGGGDLERSCTPCTHRLTACILRSGAPTSSAPRTSRVQVHRKLPRSESLKDCMDRTIPYWADTIVPDAIDDGKNVLVASSENAIRGLLMHLFNIPKERISEIEIPTGLPLVYDVRNRCLRLLEGDFSTYNFGKSGELLFTPCQLPDDVYDEV